MSDHRKTQAGSSNRALDISLMTKRNYYLLLTLLILNFPSVKVPSRFRQQVVSYSAFKLVAQYCRRQFSSRLVLLITFKLVVKTCEQIDNPSCRSIFPSSLLGCAFSFRNCPPLVVASVCFSACDSDLKKPLLRLGNADLFAFCLTTP